MSRTNTTPQRQPHKHSVSFVIPCLNEEHVLPYVLTKIKHLKDNVLTDRKVEIIVSDNGSTDRSVEIARSFGARVVHCPTRGYGAALQCGIQAAECEAVIFADADDTYDFLEAPTLLYKLDEGYEIVLGSRMKGTIHDGAMPTLHRYLGTPILTWIINTLYAKGTYRLTDCNSGFRCFRKDAFLRWGVKSTGMEFASEMIVKVMKHGADITEVPTSLYPDKPGRSPHLRTWRDGMRHLLQIILESPELFHALGSTLWLASWILLLISFFTGPITLGIFSVFGIHTMMFALLGSIFGLTWWAIGLFIAAKNSSSVRLYTLLTSWEEDRLFWFSFWVGIASIALLGAIVLRWGIGGFSNLALERETLIVIAFGANGILLVANILTAHLIKRL
ncbi:MAG: glycosyltransferase family 2 protein [Bacteroidota bacterium]|nr:glycosyltransferase family 2 protein [Candidatus Kapabacteria bacterium]MDW8219573.1 glycosyltransferase family 2 protein [Bacteroidota bacterium]